MNPFTDARYAVAPAEGWQSGRMRRSRKPLPAVPSVEGSNPSPSALVSPGHTAQPLIGRVVRLFTKSGQTFAATRDDAGARGPTTGAMNTRRHALSLAGVLTATVLTAALAIAGLSRQFAASTQTTKTPVVQIASPTAAPSQSWMDD